MKDEKKIFLFLACCLLAVFLVGCSRDDKTTTTSPTASAAESASQAETANESTNGDTGTPTTDAGMDQPEDGTGALESIGEDASRGLEDLGTDVEDGLEDLGTDLGIESSTAEP